jgi:hypothetical protein
MENGTYQKTEAGFTPIVATIGYWVAVEETTLDDVAVGESVGVWTDEKNNKLWVDKVIRLSDITNAILLGKTFGQEAIYDIVNNKEVRVN